MSLSFSMLFEDLFLTSDSPVVKEFGGRVNSYFNPPNVAIMNAVCTPALEATSVTSSDDYVSFNQRADSGYGPVGSYDPKFKI